MDEEGNDEQGIVLLNSLTTQHPLIKLPQGTWWETRGTKFIKVLELLLAQNRNLLRIFASVSILEKSVVFCGFFVIC